MMGKGKKGEINSSFGVLCLFNVLKNNNGQYHLLCSVLSIPSLFISLSKKKKKKKGQKFVCVCSVDTIFCASVCRFRCDRCRRKEGNGNGSVVCLCFSFCHFYFIL